MTGRELAEELTDLWADLDIGEINEMLAKNVGVDLLEFFVSYAEAFADEHEQTGGEGLARFRGQLPNLLVIGYLVRLLEERVK
jgi:hypothetical protein